MAKNGLLNRTRNSYLKGFGDGQREGQQQIVDATMIWLIREGFGKARLLRFYDGLNAILDEYSNAYHPVMEQDVAQVRMDRELQEVLGDKFESFEVRHPQVKNAGYDKMPKR